MTSRPVRTHRVLLAASLAVIGLSAAGCGTPSYPDAAQERTAHIADAVCGHGNWVNTVALTTPSGSAWWYSNEYTCSTDPALDDAGYTARLRDSLGSEAQSLTGPTDIGTWDAVAVEDVWPVWGDMQLLVRDGVPPVLSFRTFV